MVRSEVELETGTGDKPPKRERSGDDFGQHKDKFFIYLIFMILSNQIKK